MGGVGCRVDDDVASIRIEAAMRLVRELCVAQGRSGLQHEIAQVEYIMRRQGRICRRGRRRLCVERAARASCTGHAKRRPVIGVGCDRVDVVDFAKRAAGHLPWLSWVSRSPAQRTIVPPRPLPRKPPVGERQHMNIDTSQSSMRGVNTLPAAIHLRTWALVWYRRKRSAQRRAAMRGAYAQGCRTGSMRQVPN